MEIQDLILNDKIIESTEIKKLIFIKKQNLFVLERLKHVKELYNDTVDSLIDQVNKKSSEIDNLNNMFMENNKHLKYILTNLAKF
jgi:hypothetical protein